MFLTEHAPPTPGARQLARPPILLATVTATLDPAHLAAGAGRLGLTGGTMVHALLWTWPERPVRIAPNSDGLDKPDQFDEISSGELVFMETKSVRAGASSCGRIRVRSKSAAGGKSSTAGEETAEVTVGRNSLKALRQHEGALRKVLTTYADALVKAERLGKSFELVIKVRPDRAEPAVEERPAEGDALDRALIGARRRGAARVAEIMKSPDMLNARAFGPLIGASHETINQKRRAGEVLALEGATRGLRYPKWQITDDGRLLPGLAAGLMRNSSAALGQSIASSFSHTTSWAARLVSTH